MRWNADEAHIQDKRGAQYSVDVDRSRFPYAIVWTPLPMISWLLPFIGHMGICDSRGVVYDFAGPYYIGIDSMAFFDKAKQQLEDTLNRGEERRAAGAAATNLSSPRISKAHSPLLRHHSSFEKSYYSDHHSYRR